MMDDTELTPQSEPEPQEQLEQVEQSEQVEPLLNPEKKKTDKSQLPRRIKTQRSGLKFSISSFMLIIFCSFLLVVSTFLQLDITHFGIPAKLFSGEDLKLQDYVQTFTLIPQVPAVMFITGLLGRKFGLASVIIYLITGLFILPVFALGGGWQYMGEYGFGYLLAYIPAVFLTGTILKDGFTYKNSIKAVMVGVLLIHLIGILYMLVVATFRHEGWGFISGWIVAQSGVKILYDFIFSLLSVLVAKYARLVLWLYM